ncbi:granzyme B(G,H)-like [Betta splendens]|uniref:Granzyme B(G,H)-like n=1 Tax=Betta splendens TaxID=158456 RepID=A0A6P7MEA1_BETSP|nr:granzyme B(G,H)-like [Betta splendens]
MMHSLFTFLLVHLLAWLCQYAHGSKIIHGKKVPDGMMPYMVSLQNNNNAHVCGGFLISEEFVLTAAHCDNATHVVLGTHNLKKVDNNARKQSVMKCKYPSYHESPKFGFDIMLLKLSQKVSLNKKVNLIRLSENQNLKDNQKCRVAGWGSTKTKTKDQVVELQVVDIPIINRKVCDKEWQKSNVKLPENVICAGGYKTKSGFCQGDSGGPLVCGGMAVGIVSFNFRKDCKYPNLPNIYTEIKTYVPWIKETLKKKQCV